MSRRRGKRGKKTKTKYAVTPKEAAEPVDIPNRRNVLFVVYVIATLDIVWMFLQFSITPYLARKLGFDTLWLGYLQTTVGVIQLVGGPVFGRFADLFGARMALSLSCSATIVFFLLLAIADHPAMLFIHKLPTIFMHVLPASQMVVADLSEPEKRADSLSLLGLCFGVGMIVGSMLGGALNKEYGETFSACVGAAGSAFSLMLVLMFIPKTTKVQAPTTSTDRDARNENKSIFSVGEITKLMKFPGVTRTFLVKIVAGLPSGVFQVMFSVIAMEFFKLEPQENGYLMAYFGLVSMVIQGGVIGRLTARYSEKSLLVLAIAVAAFVGLAQAYMQNVFHLCLIIIPMMFSLNLFNVITDSMLTKSVPSSETGTIMGLCSSVQSLLRTIGPTIGSFLYVNYGVSSIGFIQFIVNSIVFVILMQRWLSKTDEQRE